MGWIYLRYETITQDYGTTILRCILCMYITTYVRLVMIITSAIIPLTFCTVVLLLYQIPNQYRIFFSPLLDTHTEIILTSLSLAQGSPLSKNTLDSPKSPTFPITTAADAVKFCQNAVKMLWKHVPHK